MMQVEYMVNLYLVVMVGSKEDGYKGQPDDAGGVHGEPYVLGLVEVFW